jgi:hypothetical protein
MTSSKVNLIKILKRLILIGLVYFGALSIQDYDSLNGFIDAEISTITKMNASRMGLPFSEDVSKQLEDSL